MMSTAVPQHPAYASCKLEPLLCCLQVGTVQGGLVAFAWSPDGELVVLVTQQRQLLLMSKVRLPAVLC